MFDVMNVARPAHNTEFYSGTINQNITIQILPAHVRTVGFGDTLTTSLSPTDWQGHCAPSGHRVR